MMTCTCLSLHDPAKSAVEQQKFIVFEENLDKLFLMCSTCSKPTAEVSKTLVGSMVVVHSLCVDGHPNRWQSQPMIDSKVAGNVCCLPVPYSSVATHFRM